MTALDLLLDRMFPGDETRGLPRFSIACAATGTETGPLLGLAPELLATLQAALAALPPEEAEAADVNIPLKALRKAAPEAAQAFTLAALDRYLSAPQVVRTLRGGPAVLFPHPRALPEIDYELLLPVMERAEAKKDPS